MCGQLEVVKWLTSECKVYLYSEDKQFGRTPYEFALLIDKVDIVEWLQPRMDTNQNKIKFS